MADKGKCQVCSKISVSRCSWCRLVFYCSKEHQKQDWDGHKPNCTKKKYIIGSDEKVGRHLVASEDIKPDYIILKDKPILLCLKAHALEFIPNKVCLGCYKEIVEEDESSSEEEESGSDDDEESSSAEGEQDETTKPCKSTKSKKTCSKCGLPMCSESCAAQYWHKNFECRLITEGQINSTVVPTEGTTPSSSQANDDSTDATQKEGGNLTSTILDSVLHNLIYVRAIMLKHTNEKAWEELVSLESSDEGRRDVANLERTTKVFAILKKTFADINHPTINQVWKPDVHKILGILDVNALHINVSPVDDRELEVSAIFPTFSLLEHNCCPNTKFYLNPTTTPSAGDGSNASSNNKYLFELYCRSSVKIKKGEHLLISYCNVLMPTDKRREFLKKERLFLCECSRCEDPTELGSNFSTILCPSTGCPGFSVPVPKAGGGKEDTVWKCQKCSKVTQAWQVKKVDSKLCEMVGKTKPNLGNYRELLSKMEELVHPDYYLNFVVNHSLIQMYGEDESTVHDKVMLEAKVALSNRLLHLIKLLDPGMAKLNIYSAVIYYEMQSAILALAGGEVDDDFKTLRYKPETVKLAKLYLQKCIDCFKYELLNVPENKLKNLARKKMEYLDFILRARNKLGP